VVLRGHAIECRINAEDASKNFAPAPGRIGAYHEPSGPGVRVDSGVEADREVSQMYDPMIAKLIVWDADRESATRRMVRALGEYEIETLKTLLPFHKAILQTDQWANAETCRDLIEDRAWLKTLAFPKAPKPADADKPIELVTRDYTVEVSGKRFEVRVVGSASGGVVAGRVGGNPSGDATGAGVESPVPARQAPKRAPRPEASSNGHAGDVLVSPLQGTVFKVVVEHGATVVAGDLICVIEAMKMENEITAHKSGVVTELPVAVGAAISTGDTLAVIGTPAS
jgi:acetyl-CoA/propionyl-CoA carboxylase, biotin carboxylase, biotin carboxyl carrier protein